MSEGAPVTGNFQSRNPGSKFRSDVRPDAAHPIRVKEAT